MCIFGRKISAIPSFLWKFLENFASENKKKYSQDVRLILKNAQRKEGARRAAHFGY